MNTEFDVFEILENGSVKWHLCVQEKQRALSMLRAVGSRTFNECFATDLETQEIIGRVNQRHVAASSVINDTRPAAN
jgi:hypothetical protein